MKEKKKITVIGQLRMHPDGFGFVIPDKRGEIDVFIPPKKSGDALNRDRVEVEILESRERKPKKKKKSKDSDKRPASSDERREGRVIRVLDRGTRRFVGKFARVGKEAFAYPDDDRIPGPVVIPEDGVSGAREGQTVAVQIISFPGEDGPLTGKVVQIMGARGEFTTEVEAVLHHHDIPLEFPDEVENEAEKLAARWLAASPEERRAGRQDMRTIPFVTIDGESAKDFDDAVAARLEADRNQIRIWVAIADVAAFIGQFSDIDNEARARGTSIYFPDRCIPMLPSVLSDNLCSLRPGEDRLALVVEYAIDLNGKINGTHFHRAVINSHARLTYTKVQKILVEKDAATCAEYEKITPMLEILSQAALILQKTRRERGSIDFDLPEPEIVLDMQGAPEAIIKAPRYFSHEIIENLMVATNEVVARHLTNASYPCVFRIHPPPKSDRLEDFMELVVSLGLPRIPKNPSAKQLGKVIDAVRDHPEARLVNHNLLRSMQQAFYDTDNQGHFGLASACYGHFTSPIRRYPDLIVHRLLIAQMGRKADGGQFGGGKPKVPELSDLEDWSQHCSRRERVSMEAEREMAKLYSTSFMKQHCGETFKGIISHITKFGFYVELIDFFIEGLVSKKTLTHDKFNFDEGTLRLVGKKTGEEFRIGDKVEVTVHEVNMEERQIIFTLHTT